MAEEQQQQQQQQVKVNMPQARMSVVDDDYVYEIQMPPRAPFDDPSAGSSQSGGMASQFETVSSGINNAV